MNNYKKTQARPFRLECYAWALAVLWTVVVTASLSWNFLEMGQNTLEIARVQARAAFEKDIVYRRWNAEHGGFYVPVTEKTQPNPYLSHVPERDITSPSGKLLTLVNPAYMTRQVHALGEEEYGILEHFTSLNPIRPENAPDPWETDALEDFEREDAEISSVEELEGREYMRLMRPLVTEKSCLKCHAKYGYQEGDICGGISVSIPMAPLKAVASQTMLLLGLGHVFMWLMGLSGIILGTRRLKRSDRERNSVEEALRKSHQVLERRVEERTAELSKSNVLLKEEITERKQVEEEVRKLSRVIEHTADLVVITNKEGVIEYVNPAFIGFTGFTSEEVIGKKPNILKSDEHSRHFYKELWGTILAGKPFHGEIINKRKDGRLYYEEKTISPLQDAEGNITHFVSTAKDITKRKQAAEALQKAHDELEQRVNERTADLRRTNEQLKQEITERKQAEQALADAKEQLNLALVSAKMGVWDFLITEGKLIFDEAKEQLYGLRPGEFKGTYEAWLALIHPEDVDRVNQKVLKCIESGETYDDEYRVNTKSGMLRHMQTRGDFFLDDQGKAVRAAGLTWDITERVAMKEELVKTKDAAEIATQAKSDFLANMSHELRTPLNAIIGFSEILSDQTFGELSQKQLKYTNNVLTSGRHLLALINDILDLSKVEAGKMELERSTVAPKSLLGDSLVMIKEKALKCGVSLELRIPDELSELKFQVDERKLKQIMFNLLSNAVKFTPDGGTITVAGRQEKDELIVTVSDTGIGIKQEDLEHVFGEFEQLDSSYARQQQGTGLGLALTRKLVELHGGRIRTESDGEGEGSTFTFMIPIKTDERAKEKQS